MEIVNKSVIGLFEEMSAFRKFNATMVVQHALLSVNVLLVFQVDGLWMENAELTAKLLFIEEFQVA